MRLKIFACVFSCIMFTGLLFAQETITVQPDDKVVTNEMPVSAKGEPLEKDLLKSIDLAANTLFSIKLNATNFDRYIRITSYSTNLDFVRFTRDKTNAFLTFTTLTPGIAKLNFQVDTEENIIKRYIYTINVTNGDAITDTNSTMFDAETTNEAPTTNDMIMDTNETVTNTTDTNTTNNTAATNATATNAANNTTQQQQTVTKTTQAEDNSEVALLFKSAEELKNMKDYDNAISLYEKALSKLPTSPEIYYNMGTTLSSMGDMESAVQAFDMAKKNFTEKTSKDIKSSTYYNAGISKIEMEDYAGAIEKLIESLVNNPNDNNAKSALEYAKKKLEEQKKNSGESAQNNNNDNQDNANSNQNSQDR